MGIYLEKEDSKKLGGWLEGNAVITPEGGLAIILRVNSSSDTIAAMVKVSSDGKTATFDPEKGLIKLPGAGKKFTIRYDPASRKYWTLTNLIHPEDRGKGFNGFNPERTRNTQALLCSDNLTDWMVRDIVLRHPDVETHGFQYLDWQFEGADIIAVSRTAWDQPDGWQAICQHHANYLTFHRISDFRTRQMATTRPDR